MHIVQHRKKWEQKEARRFENQNAFQNSETTITIITNIFVLWMDFEVQKYSGGTDIKEISIAKLAKYHQVCQRQKW